jgi:LuxR family maltose regulon positive regulatory protein
VRQRLLDELDRSRHAALTLVAAPVGFGKSVLLQTWCARTDTAVAWVSLDADEDPRRLWTYIATAVDRIRWGLGRQALARLRSPDVQIEHAVEELVNGVSAYGQPLAIVLDDLHLVADENLRSLEYAVALLPSHARIIAATRLDPRLPLARLRASGALSEIRASQLAFTVNEARELLVDRARIAVDDKDVELLVERTEGWPAGLYLAALWLRRLKDPGAGIEAFHGDHRHVADYLTGEVLDALDADARRFLTETSVLGTFSAPLSDAVLGRSDSARRLRELERTNGFLIALGAHRRWFRYHHLFGELLRLELATVDPGASVRLHRRASDWCRDHGRIEDALKHAAAARDTALVAEVLAEHLVALLRSGRLVTLLTWCGKLPKEALIEHPELAVAAALASGLIGRPAHVRRRFIALAERGRSERSHDWTPQLEVELGIVRTSWVVDNLEAAIALARKTATAAGFGSEQAVRALANLAFLLYLAGESAEATAWATQAIACPELADGSYGLVIALSTLSVIDSDAGRFVAAEQAAREALAAARKARLGQTGPVGAARVALARALGAQGKVHHAEREAIEGERLLRQSCPEAVHLHALLVLAELRARRGRLDRGNEDLREIEKGLETLGNVARLREMAAVVARTLEKSEAVARVFTETPSAAELRVLSLLPTDLSLRDIGRRLFISVNTVRTHTRALYRKLGVTSREEAVARANALGLLGSSVSPG